jgi:Uma2 family endonuclease
MKSAALVSVEEYLRTVYRPDCDYLDGEVQERNLGELEHSDLQAELVRYLRNLPKNRKIFAFPEWRVQVSPTRFRIPDVCICVGTKPTEPILRTPPFACIEILSPEDRWSRTQQRIDDYLNFVVPYIWVIEPASRRAWACSKDGNFEIHDGVLRAENPSLEIPLADIFSEL